MDRNSGACHIEIQNGFRRTTAQKIWICSDWIDNIVTHFASLYIA